jgi:hypothetical protein
MLLVKILYIINIIMWVLNTINIVDTVFSFLFLDERGNLSDYVALRQEVFSGLKIQSKQ